MKHAGPTAIQTLEPFLEKLRAIDLLNEKRPGVFYRRSRAFLHFHEDPKGLFADVKIADDFKRFPVNTERQQEDLLGKIERQLQRP